MSQPLYPHKRDPVLYGVVVNAMSQPLYPHKRDPVLIVQEAAWVPQLVWTSTENLAPTRFELRTVQPLESPYRPANYTILAADSVVKHKFSVRCLYISIPGKFLQVLPPDSHQLLLLCNILLLFNVTMRQILLMCKRGETIDSYQFRNPFTVSVMTTCQNDIVQSEEL